MNTLSFILLMFTLISSMIRYKRAFGQNIHASCMYRAWSGTVLMFLYVLYLFYNFVALNSICITVTVCILFGIGYDNLTNIYPGRGWIASIVAFVYIILSINTTISDIQSIKTIIWTVIFIFNIILVVSTYMYTKPPRPQTPQL